MLFHLIDLVQDIIHCTCRVQNTQKLSWKNNNVTQILHTKTHIHSTHVWWRLLPHTSTGICDKNKVVMTPFTSEHLTIYTSHTQLHTVNHEKLHILVNHKPRVAYFSTVPTTVTVTLFTVNVSPVKLYFLYCLGQPVCPVPSCVFETLMQEWKKERLAAQRTAPLATCSNNDPPDLRLYWS